MKGKPVSTCPHQIFVDTTPNEKPKPNNSGCLDVRIAKYTLEAQEGLHYRVDEIKKNNAEILGVGRT